MYFKKLEHLISITEKIKKIYLSILLCEKKSLNSEVFLKKLATKLDLEREMYEKLNYTDEELIEIINFIEGTYKIDKYTTIPELIIKSDSNVAFYRIYFRLLEKTHKKSDIEKLNNYFKMDDINLSLYLIEILIKNYTNEFFDIDTLISIKYTMSLLFSDIESNLIENNFLVNEVLLNKAHYTNIFKNSLGVYENIKKRFHLDEANNLFNTFILMCLSKTYSDEDFFIFCIFFKTVISNIDPQILENFKIKISNLYRSIEPSKFILINKIINISVNVNDTKPITLIKDDTN